MAIEIILNKIWIYGAIFLLSGFFLFRLKLDFNPDKLLDYAILLTTKLILFFVFMSFLLICIMSILDGTQTKIHSFIEEITLGLLYWALFNYVLFGALKLIIYFVDFFKKNDLLAFSLLKEVNKK